MKIPVRKMHLAIVLAFLFFTNTASGQDTIYFNANWDTCLKTNAKFYRTFCNTNEGYTAIDHFINGGIQMIGKFENGIKNGEFEYFEENGSKLIHGFYKQNARVGNWTFYYIKNGKENFYSISFPTQTFSKNEVNPSFASITNDYGFQSLTFNTNVHFDSTYFMSSNFNASHFDSICFRGARFGNTTLFYDCLFNKKASFSNTNFHFFTNFNNAKFKQDAFFNSTIFNDEVYFKNIKSHVYIGFKNTVFKDYVSFENSSFRSCDFDSARFEKDANFSYISLNGYLDFSNCFLGSKIMFISINTHDSSEISFDNCVLADTIDFSYSSKIKNPIDLTLANFHHNSRYDSISGEYKHHYINLYNSNISKIRLDYFHFRLILTEIVSEKDLTADEAKSVYEALLKNFEEHGQMDSYEILDKEYQRYKGQKSILHWQSWLPDWWWGFGYNKERVFGHTLLFLTLFTLITFFRINKLNNKEHGVYYIENVPQSPKMNSAKNIGLRLWYSFSYTATLFFLFSLKIDKINFRKKIATMYILIIYSVGLLCLGYIANFIFQK